MQGWLKIFCHFRRRFFLAHQHAIPCLKTARLQYIPTAIAHFPVSYMRCSNKSNAAYSCALTYPQNIAGLGNNHIRTGS